MEEVQVPVERTLLGAAAGGTLAGVFAALVVLIVGPLELDSPPALLGPVFVLIASILIGTGLGGVEVALSGATAWGKPLFLTFVVLCIFACGALALFGAADLRSTLVLIGWTMTASTAIMAGILVPGPKGITPL